MSRKKVQYPKNGKIRTTGEVCTILRERVAPGGLKTYIVKFPNGHEYEWSREKVVVSRG